MLKATFDTANKGGAVVKNIYVVSNDPLNPQKSVQLVAKIENFHRAAGSNFAPEKIFSPGCVDCHAGRAKGKSGAELYAAVCTVCHRPGGSAMLLDQKYVAKARIEDLRQTISAGEKKMPGFSTAHGGPLTGKQIESLLGHLKMMAGESGDRKATTVH